MDVKCQDGVTHRVARKLSNKFYTTTTGLVIKPSNGEILPEDEPLFVMRARDRLALQTLEYYNQVSMADGCNDYHHNLMSESIQAFRQFAIDHPELMKQPSITRGK